MALPMTSGQFVDIVAPLLNEPFDGLFREHSPEWSQFCPEFTGIPRSYHEEPVLYGFNLAQEVPEGQAVSYDSGGEMFAARYIYKVYGLAYALTQQLIEDGDHISMGRIYSEQLGRSLIETKEVLCANILNRAQNGAYLGGDGVALVSASHPLASGGAYSNLLGPSALSQTSVEQALQTIMAAIDDTGRKINLKAKQLIVPTQLAMQAHVIVNSVLRSGTANNDVNPITNQMLPKYMVATRLTSATAWFLQTDAPRGVRLAMRRRLKRGMEGDFDTDSMRYKATERYAPYWTEPRNIYGNAGA